MIPFAVPNTGEIINLSQIVRVEQFMNENPPHLDVTFSDGKTVRYEDNAARFLNTEIGFAINEYRKYQIAVSSQIVTPDQQNGRPM